MLPSEWQADDSNAKQKSKKKMGNGYPDPATKDPDNIGNRL